MKVREIADLVGGEFVGDPEKEILGIAGVTTATADEISFVEKNEPVEANAGCIFIPISYSHHLPGCAIKVKDPRLAFALTAKLLNPPKQREPEIHNTAVISPSATIGKNVFIGAFTCVGDSSVIGDGTQLRAGAKIGDNVKVGDNCILHPNAFVDDGCTLGNNVILFAGVIIGTDGFGYVRGPEEYVKFPQVGTVVIEDDVEIGANSCVDKGALGETRIGKGTKIDNLVQIAHNVQIGKRVVIAAQTGISGSTVIEDDCVIGGQVGMGDHARVLSGAVIGSQAGVLPGKIVRPGIWWGTPVQPLDEYKRQNAHMKAMGRLREKVSELQATIQRLVENDKK